MCGSSVYKIVKLHTVLGAEVEVEIEMFEIIPRKAPGKLPKCVYVHIIVWKVQKRARMTRGFELQATWLYFD